MLWLWYEGFVHHCHVAKYNFIMRMRVCFIEGCPEISSGSVTLTVFLREVYAKAIVIAIRECVSTLYVGLIEQI